MPKIVLSVFQNNPVKFPYLTRYDLLKTLAVITMVIDHIGDYFFFGEDWWRAIGRLSFPVWFFLIGCARSRQIGAKLLLGASGLVLANLLFGFLVVPLNALWSIIFIRLSIGWIIKRIGSSEIKLFTCLFLFILLNPFLNFAWEYGGIAFIFALCGHYARNGFSESKNIPFLIGVLSFLSFIYIQQTLFNFAFPELIFMVAGTFVIMLLLFFYLPKPGPALKTDNLLINRFLMLGGRYTLEIYIIHLLLFETAVFILSGCGSSLCVLR